MFLNLRDDSLQTEQDWGELWVKIAANLNVFKKIIKRIAFYAKTGILFSKKKKKKKQLGVMKDQLRKEKNLDVYGHFNSNLIHLDPLGFFDHQL